MNSPRIVYIIPGISALKALEYFIANGEPVSPLALNLELVERRAILRALEMTDYRQDLAAKHLGITSRQLNYKITKHGITHHTWRVNKS